VQPFQLGHALTSSFSAIWALVSPSLIIPIISSRVSFLSLHIYLPLFPPPAPTGGILIYRDYDITAHRAFVAAAVAVKTGEHYRAGIGKVSVTLSAAQLAADHPSAYVIDRHNMITPRREDTYM